MKRYFLIAALAGGLAIGGCKGNGSTNADSDANTTDTTKGLNDGTGAPGSGTGSSGSGTVGDTTRTQQDTVNGSPQPQKPDTKAP